MKNYKLVPMDRSHIPAIAQIERECFSAPWSEAMLEEELYNPLASFIVAQRPDGAVLGYSYVGSPSLQRPCYPALL